MKVNLNKIDIINPMDKIINLTDITNIKLTTARKSILELLINSNKPLSYEDMKDKISMDKATFIET